MSDPAPRDRRRPSVISPMVLAPAGTTEAKALATDAADHERRLVLIELRSRRGNGSQRGACRFSAPVPSRRSAACRRRRPHRRHYVRCSLTADEVKLLVNGGSKSGGPKARNAPYN
ncbi:serine peptidase domain protein [Mycobacteroides abscessus]|uniref:hypothetical protein n=1 Tax=Mycobacteroides abscessus TaxID=36809 RepID=UPI00044AEA49|nr:hypothetical protein [Mycobacteroides abscessus]EUA68486.1 serine peptidase domain protein [Mycobacteroides abscessus]